MADYSEGIKEQPKIEDAAVDTETKEGTKDTAGAAPPLASISEVYSFGPGKFWYVFGGIICSAVTGCVFPAMAFIFADSFEQLGASASEDAFLGNIRTVAYTLMILG